MSDERIDPTHGRAPGSGSGRTSNSQRMKLHSSIQPRRMRALVFALIVITLGVGMSVVWAVITTRQLDAAIVDERAEHVAQAAHAFSAARARAQADLQGACRVLVEDPRLKATLATEGMDAATVADILGDLAKLRGRGFLLVLSPDAKVFAQASAPELRGLDLSDASVVKKAVATSDAVVGAWMLGGKVMDLSLMAIRFGDDVVAYLVVGQAVDQAMIESVASETGAHVANAIASTVTIASSSTTTDRQVFAQLATETGPFMKRVLTRDGGAYVTGVVDLVEGAQSHRLLISAPVAAAPASLSNLRWFLLAPPLLVFLAVLFSLSGTRSSRRS